MSISNRYCNGGVGVVWADCLLWPPSGHAHRHADCPCSADEAVFRVRNVDDPSPALPSAASTDQAETVVGPLEHKDVVDGAGVVIGCGA